MMKKNNFGRLMAVSLSLAMAAPLIMAVESQARGGFGGGGRGFSGGAHFGGGERFAGGDRFGEGTAFGGGERYGNGGERFAGANRDVTDSAMDHAWNGVWQAPGAGIAHVPTDGGFAHASFANHENIDSSHVTAALNKTSLTNQGNTIRNSLNRNNINVNKNFYNNNFNHGWSGYGPGWHAAWWGYPGAWYAPGWAAATAWTAVGFSALAAFEGLAANSQPVEEDYGTNVVYNGGNVYVNGQPNCSAQDYFQQAQQLASVGQGTDALNDPSFQMSPAPQQPQQQWKPLGVFSLVQGNQTQSTMLMQLAMNPDGRVKGNYYNQLTDETSTISGSLDKKTQRIAWTIANNQNTVFDTSLGNLCQVQSPVLVHFGSGNTQQMALVRMNPPANLENQTASKT